MKTPEGAGGHSPSFVWIPASAGMTEEVSAWADRGLGRPGIELRFSRKLSTRQGKTMAGIGIIAYVAPVSTR